MISNVSIHYKIDCERYKKTLRRSIDLVAVEQNRTNHV